MIRSMTGFGEAEADTAAGRAKVEIRTVNHRYFNPQIRLPNALARLEAEVREWLKPFFSRGNISCSIRLERGARDPGDLGLRLDDDRINAYLLLMRQLEERHGVQVPRELSALSRFGDILIRDEDADDGEVLLPGAAELQPVVGTAARQAVQMREAEGARLADDLRERLDEIAALLGQIATLAPARLIAERDRLRQAVAELMDGGAADEQRLAQEVAHLAERWDINEELVRFRSHTELFRDLLGAAPEEPVGKRLGFLVQEMHREANTTGSKANDAAIAHHVVGIKDQIERLREQVDNVE